MTAVPQLTPKSWYELLFAECEGWVSTFAIDGHGNRVVRWCQNSDDFSAGVAPLVNTHDVWFGCCTRRERVPNGRRGSDADCFEIPGVWLDVDVAGPNHKTAENLPPDEAAGIRLLKAFPRKPSIVLNTGGGFQAWWLFPEPLYAEDAVTFLSRWGATWIELAAREGWHIDSVFDPARVLRVPSTLNHKSDPPRPVTTVHYSPDRRWTLADLDEYTLDIEVSVRSERVPYEGDERAGDRFNATADPGLLLEQAGCVFDHADRDGTRHYRAPHHAKDGMTGICIYPDGHTTIYSETFARQMGMEKRRPYDPFGLLTHFEHAGDWTAANHALEPRPDAFTVLTRLVDPVALAIKRAQDAAPAASATPSAEDEEEDTSVLRGGAFIWDESADIEIRWGEGHNVLWAAGESMMIVGPPGVGKTTIAHQLVGGLIGIETDLLGLPVIQAKRVLYLAMDRPRQIRRAMRRLFRAEDRTLIDERLLVRPGPLPADLAKNPEMLVELARKWDCDVLVVDSLKDAAIKLSDDETGGGVNRAIQWCNAESIDICVLHHQRKGQDGAKPTKLDDVYGSAWLTAGTGSVALIWGEAGSEQVELIHLKQPLDPVGPLNLEHDHRAGRTIVVSGFDALRYLRLRGAKGATLMDVARAEHGPEIKRDSPKVKKTERRLKGLVHDGLATSPGQESTDGGRFGEARYVVLGDDIRSLVHDDSTVDITVDTAP